MECTLIGKLSPPKRLTGKLSQPYTLSGKLSFGIGEYSHYNGPYTVDPSAHENVVLDTSNKLMTDDITVNKIYYSETSNPSGGKTVFIA